MRVDTPPRPVYHGSRYLSGRERQVLALLADGLSNKEIAAALALSVETVKSHVTKMKKKLEARNRTHAVSIAYRDGLLPAIRPDR